MNALENFNKAMEHIEENLDGNIDVERVAQFAGCSEYHFRRMFSFLSGISLGEYIRNRRLSAAASIVTDTDEKIIDVAMKFGYESPDAFTKAFQALHGVTPAQARKTGALAVTFLPVTFQLSIRGGTKMDVRIIEKGSFNLIGVSGRIPLIYKGPNPHTADVWRKLRQEDLLVLMEYSETVPRGIISAYGNYEEKSAEGTMFDLFVGIAVEKPLPERLMKRFDKIPVEASAWAVFTSCGKHPDAAQETWARIADTWFPSSDYEMTGGPEMSWFESYDFDKPDFKSEIWIPVRKHPTAGAQP